MGQVYDIPFSALIATLLLKKRVVTFKEIIEFERVVISWGYNYYVIEDEYISDMPYSCCIDNCLSKFLVNYNDSFCIRNNMDYDHVIGDKTIREVLEEVAGYPGDMLLNYIGYQKTKKDNRRLSKVKRFLFRNHNKSIGDKVKIVKL